MVILFDVQDKVTQSIHVTFKTKQRRNNLRSEIDFAFAKERNEEEKIGKKICILFIYKELY